MILREMHNITVIILILVSFLTASVEAQDDAGPEWERPRFEERKAERYEMVENDIRKYPYKQVTDKKVLEAMKAVPRHLFVPEKYSHYAYENHPLPLGWGQTISQPFIVAHMTQLLDVERGEKVLEIGTGCGYQAAVLSELTPKVYSIEIVEVLGKQAGELLERLGYLTIKLKTGDGYKGWAEYAPYDGIIVTCAPDHIPGPLLQQLAPGGRMVIPVGEEGKTQYLVVVEKGKDGKLKERIQYPVSFVPMTGEAEK